MKINFYLADEIRTESNGKQLVLGLYPDHVVLVEVDKDIPETDPEGNKVGFVLDQLTFSLCVSEAVGNFKPKVQFYLPSGEPIGEPSVLPDFDQEKGGSHSLHLHAKPFPFKEPGKYKLQLTLNDKPHDFFFELRVIKK